MWSYVMSMTMKNVSIYIYRYKACITISSKHISHVNSYVISWPLICPSWSLHVFISRQVCFRQPSNGLTWCIHWHHGPICTNHERLPKERWNTSTQISSAHGISCSSHSWQLIGSWQLEKKIEKRLELGILCVCVCDATACILKVPCQGLQVSQTFLMPDSKLRLVQQCLSFLVLLPLASALPNMINIYIDIIKTPLSFKATTSRPTKHARAHIDSFHSLFQANNVRIHLPDSVWIIDSKQQKLHASINRGNLKMLTDTRIVLEVDLLTLSLLR